MFKHFISCRLFGCHPHISFSPISKNISKFMQTNPVFRMLMIKRYVNFHLTIIDYRVHIHGNWINAFTLFHLWHLHVSHGTFHTQKYLYGWVNALIYISHQSISFDIVRNRDIVRKRANNRWKKWGRAYVCSHKHTHIINEIFFPAHSLGKSHASVGTWEDAHEISIENWKCREFQQKIASVEKFRWKTGWCCFFLSLLIYFVSF